MKYDQVSMSGWDRVFLGRLYGIKDSQPPPPPKKKKPQQLRFLDMGLINKG